MWVLRSKVNGKLFCNVSRDNDQREFIWDDMKPYEFDSRGKAVFARTFGDPENVWDMVAEEIVECL